MRHVKLASVKMNNPRVADPDIFRFIVNLCAIVVGNRQDLDFDAVFLKLEVEDSDFLVLFCHDMNYDSSTSLQMTDLSSELIEGWSQLSLMNLPLTEVSSVEIKLIDLDRTLNWPSTCHSTSFLTSKFMESA